MGLWAADAAYPPLRSSVKALRYAPPANAIPHEQRPLVREPWLRSALTAASAAGVFHL